MTTETEYESAAMAQFMSDGVMLADGVDTDSDAQTSAREKQIKATSKAFYKAMNSRKPPQSRDDSIRRAVGLLGMMLGMMLAAMFPQYALAIKVAGFLWDIFHQGT